MNTVYQKSLVAKLKKSGVDEVTKKRLAGVKNPLDQVVKYAESLSMSLASPSAPSIMSANVEGFAARMNSALTSKLADAKTRLGNDFRGQRLYTEVQNLITRDMKRVEERIDSEVKLFAESMLAGSYTPFQLAILPHVYLETIAATSRFLMPTKEYVSEQVPPRRLLVRQLKVDGNTYDFPNCLKNPEIMRKLYSAGSEAIEFKLTATGGPPAKLPSTFNIFTESGVGVAGQDTLVPVLDVISIKYTDAGLGADTEETLPVEHIDNAANNYTRGRIYKSHKSIKAGATDEVFVSGEVEFSTGNVKLHGSDSIKEITFRAYKSGAYNRSFASIDIETKPIIQTIKQRLNLIFDYDPGDMINFLSLENIDGVLEGQSIIFEIVTAAKDQYAYDKLEEGFQEAKRLEGLNINLDETMYGIWEEDYYELPGTTGVLPGSIDQWTRDEMGRLMRKIHSNIDHRFRSTSGMQYNWYGSPVTVMNFVPSDIIISKNENYGGMVTDYEVFGVEITGKLAKVVATERVKDEAGLRCVPFSEMDAQPTYEFQQAQHALFSDGTLRHPTRPHMPAIAYYDYFDCQWIYAMFGQINTVAGPRP